MGPEGIILVNSPITTFQQSLTHSVVLHAFLNIEWRTWLNIVLHAFLNIVMHAFLNIVLDAFLDIVLHAC